MTTDDHEGRNFVHGLFSDPELRSEAATAKPDGCVPREGANFSHIASPGYVGTTA